MSEETQVKQIKMTNSKKEMLEAYNSLVKLLQKKKEEEMNPIREIEEKRNKEIAMAIDSLSCNGVVKKNWRA
jgi:hypothetical protein